MKKTTYIRMTDGLKNRPKLLGFLIFVNKILPLVVMGIYGFTLMWLLWERNGYMIPAIAFPAVTFAALTELRAKLNAPRPYEVFGHESAFPKHKEGKSFPSRHVFSAFVIGTTLCFVAPVAGVCVLLCGGMLAALRVVGGVHFIKDVVCGAAIGVLCGLLMLVW